MPVFLIDALFYRRLRTALKLLLRELPAQNGTHNAAAVFMPPADGLRTVLEMDARLLVLNRPVWG
ncbi:MAG TPA: hypothetical protein GXX47_07310 [Firmicutes bacterium]|nr:hypothetical protein [Bacillota bacterium]